MSTRKVCAKKGHKFGEMIGLPYTFCRRLFCGGCAVSSWAPPSAAVALHNAIPEEDREPPVELAADGQTVLRGWGWWDEEPRREPGAGSDDH